jgi:hypothetical protein
LGINFRVTLYNKFPPLHMVVLCKQYGQRFSILYKMLSLGNHTSVSKGLRTEEKQAPMSSLLSSCSCSQRSRLKARTYLCSRSSHQP